MPILLLVPLACPAAGDIADLLERAQRLTAPGATPYERFRAMRLFNEGVRALEGDAKTPAAIRYRFWTGAVDFAVGAGQYDTAARRVRAALEVAPSGEKPSLARRQAELERAAALLKEALDARRAGRYAAEMTILTRIAERYPFSAAWVLQMQSQSYFEQGKIAEATTTALRIIRECGGTPLAESAYLEVGSLYRRQNQPEKALALYQEYLKTFGDAKDRGMIHYRIALACVDMGRRDDAVREIALASKALGCYDADERRYQEKRIEDAEKRARALPAQ